MSTLDFTLSMAEHILEHDDNPVRFEKFCNDLFSEVDGAQYVPTSRTHDLGRDGRATTLKSGPNQVLLCCSLRDDIEEKATQDLQRIAENAKPQTLRMCFSKRVSESQRQAISKRAAGLIPSVTALFVDGQAQIATLAFRHPTALRHRYRGELELLRSVLLADADDEEAQVMGMRIALTTQLHDDAQTLRDEISRNLVLNALRSGRPLNLALIVKSLSDSLHLSRQIRAECVRPTVDQLVASGHLAVADGKYAITESGRQELRERTDQGSRTLLDGRQKVKSTVRSLLGEDLSEEEFSHLWKILQEGLANLFMSNGIQIIEAIASILHEDSPVSAHAHLEEGISELAGRVAGTKIGGPRATDIAQAVRDMFHETESYAFEWLTSLCSVYIGVCSLGLEPFAQREVINRLREIDLLFDTDVILSLLAEAEPHHRAITDIVRTWRRINGRTCVSESVLQEAASHAWISQFSYDNCRDLFPTLSDSDAPHLVDNAFVRAFRKVARGRFGQSQWKRYIGQYIGTDQEDYSRILEQLREEGFQFVPEEDIDLKLANEVALAVRDAKSFQREEMLTSWYESGMAERDGRLVALLERMRKRARVGGGGTAVVLSSSKTLRVGCQSFRERLGDPAPVIPLGPLGYLLGLTPGVTIGLGSLQKVLFDTGWSERVSGLEALAMRVIKASSQYSIPWSRRGALRREVRNSIAKYASERNQEPRQFEKQLIRDAKEQPAALAQVIAEAVDKLAPSRHEKEIDELKARIRELEGKAR